MAMTGLRVVAPAKVNLFLHVTGKRDDGYHLLESLTVFAQDVADIVQIEQADRYTLNMTGPFSDTLKDAENLVTKAAHLFEQETNIPVSVAVQLEKTIPPGAGLGGGSADAAAMIRALEHMHKQKIPDESLLRLGADVPVCYRSRPCVFSGIGERITPAPVLPEFHMLLIWPGRPALTKDVFARYGGFFRTDSKKIPPDVKSLNHLIGFLEETDNDLSNAAETLYPDIRAARKFLEGLEGCLLARMSGSGSCVFGIFETNALCQQAKERAVEENGRWWVRTTKI